MSLTRASTRTASIRSATYEVDLTREPPVDAGNRQIADRASLAIASWLGLSTAEGG
jgi:hypothetical protein